MQKVIGEGAQAKVLLAKHLLTKNTFAIKVIDRRHICATMGNSYIEPQLTSKMAMELMTCSQLVQVYDVFEDESNYYIVMEYLASGTLFDYLSKVVKQPLGEKEASAIVKQVSIALQTLHEHNIIHRDVKLDNVLFDGKTGVCKLADFGAAVQLKSTSATDSMVIGTRGYFAPEMLQDTCPWYDIAVDVYSLGALMHVLLTIKLPFMDSKQSRNEYVARVLNEPLNLEAN